MPRPLAEPLCYAAAYSLHLYCDQANDQHRLNEFPHELVGETFADCARQAQRRGWVIHRKSRTATCPKCTRKS